MGLSVRVVRAHDWSGEPDVAVLAAVGRRVAGANWVRIAERLPDPKRALSGVWRGDERASDQVERILIVALLSTDAAQVSRLCQALEPAVRAAAALNPLSTDEDRVMVALLA